MGEMVVKLLIKKIFMKKNIIISLFPITVLILFLIIEKSFLFTPMDLKGITIISIALTFPIVFFIQGIIVILKEANKIIPLVISLVSYFIYLVSVMKKTAFIYIIFYFALYLLGISLCTVIQKYRK